MVGRPCGGGGSVDIRCHDYILLQHRARRWTGTAMAGRTSIGDVGYSDGVLLIHRNCQAWWNRLGCVIGGLERRRWTMRPEWAEWMGEGDDAGTVDILYRVPLRSPVDVSACMSLLPTRVGGLLINT